MNRTLLTPATLAEKMGYPNATSFSNKRKQLIDEFGFPSPIPGTKRWDPRAVDDWLDQLNPANQSLELGQTDAEETSEWEAILEKRTREQ